MSDLDGLLNSKISLISQHDVKFNGTLFSIDAEQSSMVLKDVQCMGTEDRVTDPRKQIASNPVIIPYVTFPGDEIKDLIVHDSSPVETAVPEAPLPVPPRKQAPPKQSTPTAQPVPTVQSKQSVPPTAQPVNPKVQPVPTAQPVAPKVQPVPTAQPVAQKQPVVSTAQPIVQQPQPRQQKVTARPVTSERQQQVPSSSISEQPAVVASVQNKANPPPVPQSHTSTTNGSIHRDVRVSSGAGTGAHLLKLKERKERGSENSSSEISAKEFDFSAGLNLFKKDDVFAEVATEVAVVSSSEAKYKKDDFFDTLSCDLTDRKEGRHTRLSASEERVLNQDTFGAIALQSTGNYRRNFNRGGYSGRGGGRGRGRGGRGRSYPNQQQVNT